MRDGALAGPRGGNRVGLSTPPSCRARDIVVAREPGRASLPRPRVPLAARIEILPRRRATRSGARVQHVPDRRAHVRDSGSRRNARAVDREALLRCTARHARGRGCHGLRPRRKQVAARQTAFDDADVIPQAARSVEGLEPVDSLSKTTTCSLNARLAQRVATFVHECGRFRPNLRTRGPWT